MKLTVSKKELHDKLKMVGKVVGPSKTLPIIENFLFTIREKELFVTGTDSAGTIEACVKLVDCDSDEQMKFAVDKTLFNALSELPDQPIEIHILPTNHISVKYHNGQFEIHGKSAEDFPIIKTPEDYTLVEMDKSILLEGIKSVLPFVANDELRPVMNGVYIHSLDNKLAFVATDANMLSCREYDSDLADFSVIVPNKAAKIIQSIVSEFNADKVKIIINDKNISVKTEQYYFTYRLIEGRYPNYRNVIPTTHEASIKLDKNEFISMIKRVSVFSSSDSRLLKMSVNSGSVNLSAQDVDYSISATETMLAETSLKEPIEIGFYAPKLEELIKSIETAECEVKLIDPMKAGIIVPVGITGVTLLIMPMLIVK